MDVRMNVAPPPPRSSGAPSRNSLTVATPSPAGVSPAPAPLVQQQSSSSSSTPSTKADYNIVSSAHPPPASTSIAVTAAPPPQALHDVDMYTALTKDLPHDAAVLQSVLYSHRSVANPDPSPDDVLQKIDQDIRKWKSNAQEHASKSLELDLVQHRTDIADQQKDLMRRDVEHNRALRRMEDIIMNLERRIESDLNSDTGIGSITTQNNDTWVEMSARHKQQREQVAALWSKKLQGSKERDYAQAEMERLTHQGKTMIEESASRAMIRNDAETERLRLQVLYGDETVRSLLMDDVRALHSQLEAEEAAMRSRLHEACGEDLRRVLRRLGAQEALSMLLHHTRSSETGMRFNVSLEEQRERCDILSSLGKSLLAADIASMAILLERDEL